MLAHKHPEDREQIAHRLTEIRDNHQSFSSRHRIIATDGSVRHVIVVADTADASGVAVGTQGFYVDVTPTEHSDRERMSARNPPRSPRIGPSSSRPGHADGRLRITADAAFDLLRWRSQDANVKLRRLAEQVVSDFVGLVQREESPTRAAYDNLLLTADRRIAEPA